MNIFPYYIIMTTGYKIGTLDIAELIQYGGTNKDIIAGYKSNSIDISCTTVTMTNIYTQQSYLKDYYNMGNLVAYSFFATSGTGNNITPGLNSNLTYTSGTRFGTLDLQNQLISVGTIPTWCTKIGVIVITPGCGGGGGQSADRQKSGAGGGGAGGGTFIYKIPIPSGLTDRNFYAYIPGGGAGGGCAIGGGTASKGAYPGNSSSTTSTPDNGNNSVNDFVSSTKFQVNGIVYKHNGGTPGKNGQNGVDYGSGDGGIAEATYDSNGGTTPSSFGNGSNGSKGITSKPSLINIGPGYYQNDTVNSVNQCVAGGTPYVNNLDKYDSSITWTNYGFGGKGGAANIQNATAYSGSGGGGGIIKVYCLKE